MKIEKIPEFKVLIDESKCIRCKICVNECSFGALRYDKKKNKIVSKDWLCVACLRCVAKCPTGAITITRNPISLSPHDYWTERVRRDIWIRAETGSPRLVSMGTNLNYPSIFDHLLLDACQVTNPPIDPLREPIELETYLGDRSISVHSEDPLGLMIEVPIIFGAMSYGSISLEAQKALAKAAKELGTLMNVGEGGLHPDLYPYGDNIIVQVASGRFGVHRDYLNAAAAVEIKIGQGAKPGIGGHLPGEKVTAEISAMRMIPEGTDALSPAPHHDIYSIEDLSQLVYAIKEATDYSKPVFVKIAAVHNVAYIASGIARSGADGIVIDGFRGGTGAAPQVIRDNLGIPIEIAIAVVDDKLREEGLRERVALIASGGIRNSGDVAKAIALGADAVAISTAALVAMGCTLCQHCYTGKCPWGIATQDPKLRARLNVDEAARRVVNLVKAWSTELKEILGALGLSSIEGLRGNREKLRGIGLDELTLKMLGVKPAGR
ncbi:MAG: 4Fe-4S dicluster domain-containing protein [Thaumarchaeota archaeon]|nr:4Fe-4S dicluster domain-containing protein [Nitrososphaerota archaeon]